MKLEVIFESNQRIQSEMILELLKEQGIDSILQSDDAAGLYPGMETYFGSKVLVRPNDFSRAKEIIDDVTNRDPL